MKQNNSVSPKPSFKFLIILEHLETETCLFCWAFLTFSRAAVVTFLWFGPWVRQDMVHFSLFLGQLMQACVNACVLPPTKVNKMEVRFQRKLSGWFLQFSLKLRLTYLSHSTRSVMLAVEKWPGLCEAAVSEDTDNKALWVWRSFYTRKLDTISNNGESCGNFCLTGGSNSSWPQEFKAEL